MELHQFLSLECLVRNDFVEQIISHSKVLDAGELNYVSQFGRHLALDPKTINTESLLEFRKSYLSEISNLQNVKHYVTDKMPHNFRFIALICSSLPESKIIHVQRNAVATCWSNYKQYFVSDRLGYCYDLEDLITFYGLYKDLMNFWQSEYSDRIYNLNYEDLTDQENEPGKSSITWLELGKSVFITPQKPTQR